MRVLLFLLIALVSLPALADPVSVLDGSVRFEPPANFRPMTHEEIALKFPRGNLPALAYSDETGGVSISVTHSQSPATQERLEELKAYLETALPKMIPNLEWLAREIVTVKDRRWVHLELTSSAIDTDIHNHLYLTAHQGRMLGFNFNATASDYPDHAADLARSFKSIVISD